MARPSIPAFPRLGGMVLLRLTGARSPGTTLPAMNWDPATLWRLRRLAGYTGGRRGTDTPGLRECLSKSLSKISQKNLSKALKILTGKVFLSHFTQEVVCLTIISFISVRYLTWFYSLLSTGVDAVH